MKYYPQYIINDFFRFSFKEINVFIRRKIALKRKTKNFPFYLSKTQTKTK